MIPNNNNKFENPVHKLNHKLAYTQFALDKQKEQYAKLQKKYDHIQQINDHYTKRLIEMEREIRILRQNQKVHTRQKGKQFEGYFHYMGREIVVGPFDTRDKAKKAVEKAKEELSK